MNIKSLVSAIALTSALALSGPVFAQTTINGAVVSEADLPAVQQRCDDLKTANDTASLTDTNKKPEDNAGAATTANAPAVNETANATTKVDLDLLTLDACVTAGLVTK